MAIKPLKPADFLDNQFVALDIETDIDTGEVYYIDTCSRLGEGFHHVGFDNWNDWFNWVVIQASVNEAYREIYAHNGGAFDWTSFVEWFIDHYDSDAIDVVIAGSKVIALQLHIKAESGNFRISLKDSLHILKSSLDKAGDKYVGQNKVSVDITKLQDMYYSDRKKFLQYVHQDTELLIKVMEKFVALLHEKVSPIGKLGLTLPSTAMKIFRQSITNELTIPTSDNVKQFLRGGYRGGRVEVFQYGEFDTVNVYDINSLYPFIMKTSRVPLSGDGYFTTQYDENSVGFWDISFSQDNTRYLPALIIKGRGAYTGRGIFTTAEVNTLLKHDGKMTVNNGYVFSDTGYLFAGLIDKLYNLRMTDKNGPLGEVCKLLMNSLYGKFAQRPESSRIGIARDTDDIWRMIPKGTKDVNGEPLGLKAISHERGIYAWKQEIMVPHEHVGIGATITGNARAYLYENICKLDKSTVFYCDTDSIHTSECVENVGNSLGQFKHEFSGSGIYAGKKLYALKNAESEKLRIKGIRLAKYAGDNLGMTLSYAHIRRLLDGDIIDCEYKSPSTFLEVLKSKGKSCKFLTRKRRIRKT